DAADLDAAVGRVHPELAFQLEVFRFAAAPDDESVLHHLPLGCALADDRAPLGAPELRIAVPAFERRAVEDRFEARVITEHERIGAARTAAASGAALTWWLPGRGRLRRHERRGCDQYAEDCLFHTAACCVTATCSQRPLVADLSTASVTASVASPSLNVGA